MYKTYTTFLDCFSHARLHRFQVFCCTCSVDLIIWFVAVVRLGTAISQSCWLHSIGVADPDFVKVAVECISTSGWQPVAVHVGRTFRSVAWNCATRDL